MNNFELNEPGTAMWVKNEHGDRLLVVNVPFQEKEEAYDLLYPDVEVAKEVFEDALQTRVDAIDEVLYEKNSKYAEQNMEEI